MRLRPYHFGLLLAGGVLVLFTIPRESTPNELLLAAEHYLNLAREARADLDAPATFHAAETKVGESRSAMMRQFGRPAFLRSYGETRRLIAESNHLIANSMEEARQASAHRDADLASATEQVRSESAEVRALLYRLPPRYHRALRYIVSAESRVRMAQAKLSPQESRDALESMQIARAEINLALRDVRSLLVGFLERRSEWNADLSQTLDWSRRTGGTALIVDKLNHAAHLVQAGKDVRQYPAELGPGWLDPKIRAGDLATPEGRYQIVSKKGLGQTHYHRAMLLNYPNEEDRQRFRRLAAAGQIPRGMRLGGMIEIHGEGGKGEDWTFGCISLRNDQLDELYPRLPVGTPVTIVGLWQEPSWLTRALQTASR